MTIYNPDNLPEEYITSEIAQYERTHNRKVTSATFTRFDADHSKQVFTCERVPFNRLRRITGYLVGSTDRWNNAKRAELNDRVKNGMEGIDGHN